jgi:DUF4097 and DUF4098 domain-containing protein YvlB
MKKREIFLVVVLILFGIIYQAVEKGKVRFAGDFSFYSGERRLKGNLFVEFPEPEKTFSGIGRITIDNQAGEIVVHRSDDGQVHLVSILRVYYTDKSEVAAQRAKVQVKAESSSDELNITLQHSSPFPYQHLRVLFRLLVPEQTALSIDNQEGDVIVKETGKEIRVRQENGRLFLESIRSGINLQLKNCNASIKNISGFADITASHGSVLADSIASFKLFSRHGDCTLKNVDQGAVVEQSFGRLDVDGAGKVDVNARHCDVRVRRIRGETVIVNKYGSILAEFTAGDVRLEGNASRIDLRHTAGGSTIIENRYANTSVQDFSGKSLDALVKNGNLDLAVTSVAERINVQAQYAELSLAFGALADPTFNIRSRHGRINVESPLSLETYVENDEYFANRIGQKPEVFISNSYGNVRLKTGM